MLMEMQTGAETIEQRSSVATKAAKLFRKNLWLILFVCVPTLISAIYYGFIASEIYVTEARFVIKSPDQKNAQSTTLANLFQTTGLSSGQEQTNEILDYIRSRDALTGLSRQMDIKAKYMRPDVDRLTRYPFIARPDTFENFYKFYGKMVDARLDHDTGVAVLTVKAFTPKDAHDVGVGLFDLSEGLVNRLNQRAQKRQVSEAESRVRDAENRVRAARIAMRQYRNDQRLFDPGEEATGVLKVSTELVAQRAALQAQIETMMAATPRNPSIPALRRQIAAVDAQIAGQTGRATGTSQGLASKVTQFENLQVEQEFATQMLNAAGASLEQSRTESMRQQFYLERVVEPGMPDMALLPHRFRNILTVLGVSLCLYLLGWMLIVGILEHRPED